MKEFSEFVKRLEANNRPTDEILKMPFESIPADKVNISAEEGSILLATSYQIAIALLREYHEWLSE